MIRYDPSADAVIVGFDERTDVTPTDLSRALSTRQCTRRAYDDTPVDEPTLRALARSGSDRIAAGRAYERFSLRADLLGIRSAFINQPIEQPDLRGPLRSLLDEPGHPQLMVRFGYARRTPFGLRRPIDDVLLP